MTPEAAASESKADMEFIAATVGEHQRFDGRVHGFFVEVGHDTDNGDVLVAAEGEHLTDSVPGIFEAEKTGVGVVDDGFAKRIAATDITAGEDTDTI